MRPHLIRINSTIVKEAPLIIYSVLATEIILCLFVLIFAPLFCVSICRVDNGAILLTAEIVRNASVNYYCSLAGAFEIQILVALYRWKWYEKSTPSTSLVLISTEVFNLIIAFANATLWLTGTLDFIYSIAFDALVLALSVSGFMSIYAKNMKQLEKLSKENISIRSYTVGRSFQIRENVLLLKYILRVMVPAAAIGSLCFACVAFNEYGPSTWTLARAIAYALWDMLFALFRAVYLIGELREHPLVRREFLQLSVIKWIRGDKSPTDPTPDVDAANNQRAADSYFAQFRMAWE